MPKLSHLICASLGALLLSVATTTAANDRVMFIELPTSTAKSSPYYAVRMPMALYPLSGNSQLSDLKIRNAKGDFLNYAWLDSTSETLKIESHTLPFFPLSTLKDDGQSKELIAFNILRQTDGSLIAQSNIKPTKSATTSIHTWIVDASKLNPAARLVQARVRIDKNFQGIAPVKIETSEDFKTWHNLGSVEQLVQLQHQGEQIQKLSLNLGHSKAKYLRISLPTGSDQAQTPPQILAIDVDTQAQELVTPLMQWTDTIKAHHCDASSCVYQVPANTPIDSLRLHLQEKNTLAKVQIFGELPPSAQPTTAHRHVRNPLYVLRHQKHVTASSLAQEFFLGDSTAYRLDLPAGEVSTEDFSLSGEAFNKIRLQIPAGVKSLGDVAPTISLGTLSRHLAFLARGDTPYRIEFSANTKEGKALDVSTLMPKFNLSDSALDFAEVRVSRAEAKQGAASNNPIITATPNKPEGTQKHYVFWAALIAALAVLGAMVWSLLRNIDREKR